jgi:hypothetical protein
MSVQHSTPNGEDHGHGDFWLAEANCPFCGQPISRKEFKEIEARIQSEERARIAEVEQGLQEKFARETAKAEAAKKAEIERAKRDAAKAAEQQVKALKVSIETTIAERVAAQQEASEKKMAEAVAAERTKAYGERMQLDAQLADLQRRLQRRTAGELGDQGEVDLFDILIAEFPADQITRVGKGIRGADVVQRVFNGGAFTGRLIVYDSKNHKNWLSKWIPKLRQDQIDAEADHAVLVSTVFPAGKSQLMVQDGVVVCSPARAAAVAHMLRRHVLQTHALGLSNADRDAKVEKLYRFLTSDRASDFWRRIESATDDMVDLDRSETTAHQKTWTRRADLIRTVQAAREDLVGTIDAIVRGDDQESLL